MCGGSKWKREVVADHKFDFVDTREFTDNGFVMRMKCALCHSRNEFSSPFQLAYEARKSKKIIASRDISYAFTNVMANNYYSLRSYDHFCFFDHISNSTKTSDDFAFFVFFTFKSWKRVLLADAPRQTINALTLYAIYLVKHHNPGSWYDIGKWFANNKSLSTSLLTVTTFLTVLVFAGSLLLLIVAGICYIPLLCHIQGNLKEYCCHKVDKRIDAVIKRRQKQRLADAAKLAQKEAQGDFSHLKNKRGEMIAKPLPQPTLPNLSVDDDYDDATSMNTRVPAPSTYTQDYYHYNSDKHSTMGDYPPPMPAYNPYSTHQVPGSHTQFQSSSMSLSLGHEDSYQQRQMYDDDNESTVHLAAAAAPFSQQPLTDSARFVSTPHGYTGPGDNDYNPRDIYQGRVAQNSLAHVRNNNGLAYESTGYAAHNPENPYDGYSSNPAAPQRNIHQKGRGYDDDGKGGGYSSAM
ncbi:hypothetical protein C0992_009485 [Termitomyces sp. T32_za158]|nr:hypothetical protein C0992_009485 [Termitomyces sp. T32_za158]